MHYCQGGKISKRFTPGSNFTDQIFTCELFGVDSAGVLRQRLIISKAKFNLKHCKAFSLLFPNEHVKWLPTQKVF